MSNDFFRFKQFIIRQDKCAMKVCTDASLFGAWIAEEATSEKSKIKSALDVGTGTGLLSLMFAQKNPSTIIDAVEIDNAAAKQAKENFETSSWNERLRVYNNSIQQFFQLSAGAVNQLIKYDLIISNPPFFKNDLKSDHAQRNVALHSTALSLEELLDMSIQLLNEKGMLSVLLPYQRTQQFIESAMEQSLHLTKKILIKQTPQHNYFRSMLLLAKEPASCEQSEMIIQDEEGKYTDAFVALLKEYYLYL